MTRPFQVRITAVALALLTLGAFVVAVLNLSDESAYQRPTDGAWWVESAVSGQPGLLARRVPADTPAARAGIKPGDLLLAIDDHATPLLAPYNHELDHVGIYAPATYTLQRLGSRIHQVVRLDTQVILEPVDRSTNQLFRLIALVYLAIGVYVLFRRWTAPKCTHFYLFCLLSFVLCAFKPTGQFTQLDWTVYWCLLIALAQQPALLLHFAATFTADSTRRREALSLLLYIPGIALAAIQSLALLSWHASALTLHRIDQSFLAYLAVYYVLTAVIFSLRYRQAASPLIRQQLKWLTRGTFLAITPFTLGYVLPYLADYSFPDAVTKLAVTALIFLPLTFSYAIVRYRLMDVDLIFKRGVTYTLTTAAVVGLYFGLVAALAVGVHTRLPWTGKWGLLAAIVITAQLFDPIKRAIQSRVDRIFEQKRYDYREALIQFGRNVTSQTDLHALVTSIVDRLTQTLLVGRLAVFVALDPATISTDAPAPARFTLEGSHGIPLSSLDELRTLDLTFLDFDRRGAGSHIFLENPQQALRLPDSQRKAARLLDLNYYLPCRVQDLDTQRTIAVIGLGRTLGGDFLSSEDMELLESLASYIGIAIQNARLYSRLERQIAEFERLKEFNENIVESVNIGIVATGLDDRVESWNTRMEEMFSLPRVSALGHPLAELLPPELTREYQRAKEQPGVRNLYKLRLQPASGAACTVNVAIAPLVTRDFQCVGRILLMEDISTRVELEGQLAQAERLSSIGMLAAGVAHEVNTPLAVISSYAQMLNKHSRENPALTPLLEKIAQQTFRASEIVNGLLNFSRTGGGELTSVNLNQVVHETLTLLEHQLKKAQVRVETDLAAALPAVHGNQGKLQQVLLNLCLNARDAISANNPPGGMLRISTTAHSGLVSLDVADSGSGIQPDDLSRIFDPFFTTKSMPLPGQRKGTGLGLAVTYGIIQEHNGKISVESTPGSGTRFHLEFPSATASLSVSMPVADSPSDAAPSDTRKSTNV